MAKDQASEAGERIARWRLKLRRHRERPTPLFSVAIGLGFIAAAVAIRIALEQFADAVAPFLLTFPAVIGATLLGGALAGAVVAIGCQALLLIYIFPRWEYTGVHPPNEIVNLAIASCALLVTICAGEAYRRAAARLRGHYEHEVRTLSLLVREMDHRTKNNLQIAAGLLASQSRSSANADVSRQLALASARVQAIASVYPKLSMAADPSAQVQLGDYLTSLCEALRQSVVPDNISLSVSGDGVTIEASQAIMVGLIVNEWVANAVKYAFAGNGGDIMVALQTEDDQVIVEVCDNGVGRSEKALAGVGTKLIGALVKSLGGEMAIEGSGGTRCRLTLPAGCGKAARDPLIAA